jgi:uncharacterized membrane protein YfcA
MEPALPWWLIPSFFIIAFLYASVGHGGASGYLALLSFVSLSKEEMATTALSLNVCVSTVALISFARAGHFVKSLAWPFLISSVPAAFIGGFGPVSSQVYSMLLAIALAMASLRLALPGNAQQGNQPRRLRKAVALPVGGAIGWLSGVVGVGGGIFLSPLLLLCRWASPKQAAAVSAGFILANSAAALLGRLLQGGFRYGATPPLLIAALAGGLLGARLGANHFSGALLKRLLAVILLIASVKLVKTAMIQ